MSKYIKHQQHILIQINYYKNVESKKTQLENNFECIKKR